MYEKFDFNKWGDGDYENRLNEIITMWESPSQWLLCIYELPLSKEFPHIANFAGEELISYRQQNITANVKLFNKLRNISITNNYFKFYYN